MTSISRQDFARQLALALSALTLAVISCAWSGNARADDIDIYSIPNTEGLRPNVLIMLDNTANWSANIPIPICNAAGAQVRNSTPNMEEGTKMGAQKCALYKLISSMSPADLSQFNFAFMLFNESPDDSGYPRQAFIQVKDEVGKKLLLEMISGQPRRSTRLTSGSPAARSTLATRPPPSTTRRRSPTRASRCTSRRDSAAPATTSSTWPTAHRRTATPVRMPCCSA
jgi:hypothetical protein